jgi:hypothetical protein
MGCCKTKIIQVLGGGAGGGPYVVAPNTPAAGQTTVTDTASGNSFIVPDASLYNFDGSLSGNRVVDMAGFDLTFQNGGDFIIDGKLTVTGMIDPIGLQLTESNTTAVGATGAGKATLYSSDGTDGQTQNHPIWKDDTGVLHDLLAGGSNIYTADGTLLANRTLTGAGFDLTFDGVNNFLVDAVASSKLQVETSVTHAAFIDVQPDFVWMSAQQASDGSSVSVISTPGFQTVALSFGATADLTINGDQGTAGQAIISQGPNLPPVWGSAGANYATADLTATGNRTHTWGGALQIENFTTGGASRAYNNGTTSLSVSEGSGGSQCLVTNGADQYNIQVNTGLAVVSAFTPAKGIASVRVDNNTINLIFGTNRDLQISGAAGTAGQVLTSSGTGVAPVWSTPAGGGPVPIANAFQYALNFSGSAGSITPQVENLWGSTAVSTLAPMAPGVNTLGGSFAGNVFTAGVAGQYEVNFDLSVTGAAAGSHYYAQFIKNGFSITHRNGFTSQGVSDYTSFSMSGVVDLAAADTFRIGMGAGPAGGTLTFKAVNITIKRIG